MSSPLPDNLYNQVGFTLPGPLSGPGPRPSGGTERTRRIHAGFYFLGFVAAIAGGFYAYDRTGSIALPVFVFFMAQYSVGRGLGDVATDPQKAQRFAYFALLPILASGVLWLTYQWWGLMWLSAILGFVFGGFLWALLAMSVFSSIHEAEMRDSKERESTGGL